jgi:hypothetical protein
LAGYFEYVNEPLVSINLEKFLTEKLIPSQELLCPVELVNMIRKAKNIFF